MKPSRLLLSIGLVMLIELALTGEAFAQRDCARELQQRNIAPELAVQIAFDCLGWVTVPGQDAAKQTISARDLLASPPLVTTREGELFKISGMTVPPVVDELFSLIVEIAVERAKREGLAVVKRRLEDGVCGLRFSKVDEKTKQVGEGNQILPATCRLIASTDLTVLVGQAMAFKAALTSDILGAVRDKALDKIEDHAPIAYSLRAALSLIQRFVEDPSYRLTHNDLWVIVDALINTPCPKCSDSMLTFQRSMAVARVYLQAIQMVKPDGPAVDLAVVVRKVLPKPASSTEYADVVEYANIAIRAALANTVAGSVNQRDGLRDAVRLAFNVAASTNTLPSWANGVAVAALDGDAPRLVVSLAEMARDNLVHSCTSTSDDCAAVRKFAALLTGVATYAMTYQPIPENATPDEKAALLKERREGRKEALESVIDAATDRSGRGGSMIWSLGIGVGATLDNPTLENETAAETEAATKRGLGVIAPLGISVQRLPDKNRFGGFHAGFSVLDLGYYITRTGDTAPDWRSILAPGVQVAWAIRLGPTASNLALIGLSYTRSQQYLKTSSPENAPATYRGATRLGFFVSYYLPLWDFN